MKSKNKKGFAVIDAVMAISIISIGILGYYYAKEREQKDLTISKKRLFLYKFDVAIRQSFLDIIKSYENTLSDYDEGSDEWGWRVVDNTSPFPYMSGGNLTYDLGGGGGGVRSLIIANFKGICTVAEGGEGLSLHCPLLKDLKYDTSAGDSNISSPFDEGTFIDPDAIPTAKIDYYRYDTLETDREIKEYDISFSMEYNYLKNASVNNMVTIRNVLESFTNATKLREIANVENNDGSGGLNNADDEFVGWHWKAFGDSISDIDTTYCDKVAGSSTCDNLNTDDIWRSGSDISRGLIMTRVVNNFLNGNKKVGIDGFGNAIYIHPNASYCGGGDLLSCSIDSLPLPQDNYITIGKPPYTSAIYIEPYSAGDGVDYGKIYITY